MPQSQRSLINSATTDLLSVVGTGVPAASLHEMMKALDQNHGETLTIDTACNSLVELALIALQLHGKLKLVQETLLTGNVSSSLDDSEETFYRGKATYYRRELTTTELQQIAGLRWSGWKKKVVQFVLKAGNKPQAATSLNPLLVGATYNQMGQNVANMLNGVFQHNKIDYRLTFAEGTDPNTGPFRFYRFKPKQIV